MAYSSDSILIRLYAERPKVSISGSYGKSLSLSLSSYSFQFGCTVHTNSCPIDVRDLCFGNKAAGT
jgi:hypothetical protein